MHQRGIADRQDGASHLAAYPDAGGRLETLRRFQRQVATTGFRDDRVGQRVLAALIEAGRQTQHLLLGEPFGRERGVERRTPLGQGSGLVHDQGVDLAEVLDRLGIAEQHAFPGGTAGRYHDRHRCGQSQCAGASDDQDRDRIENRERPRRLRTEQPPHEEGGNGSRQHSQHEPISHFVGHTLHRCARALRLRDQLHDLRQHRRRTDFFRPDHQAAGAVEGRADHAGADGLIDRDGLPGQHRLVDMGAPFDHFAVHRHLFTGAYAQAVTDMDVTELDILLAAIVAQAACGLGRQPQQGLQGSRGLRAGTQFE